MKKKIILVVTVLLVAVLSGTSIYYYRLYKKTIASQESKITELISILSEYVKLPEDELPTVATVTDENKLDKNAFFSQAKNEDMIVIYPQNGKAILYRPSISKIIDMTSVNPVNKQLTSTAEITPEPENREEVKKEEEVEDKAKVLLFNGTETVGITGPVETSLLEEYDNIEVTDRLPAEKKDYSKTIVVDTSGRFTDLVGQIAEFLGAEVTAIEGDFEDVDIVVVVGEDRI